MHLIFYFLCFPLINNIEGRVFCQDSNARPWTPFGYSCPVQCSSILHAIEKLQYMDYEKIIRQEIGSEMKNEIRLDHVDIQFNSKLLLKLLRRRDFDISPFSKYSCNNTRRNMAGISSDHIDASTTLNHIDNNTAAEKREGANKMEPDPTTANCWSLDKFDAAQMIVKIGRVECTRRTNYDRKFLRMMTDILNTRISSPFKFTTVMTEILLEKLFGKNTDLRHNIFDVNKLLLYLDRAMVQHKNHAHKYQVTLTSKRCLMMNVPGCFCKRGYVESSGQCIKPSDCTADPTHDAYLTRIDVQ